MPRSERAALCAQCDIRPAPSAKAAPRRSAGAVGQGRTQSGGVRLCIRLQAEDGMGMAQARCLNRSGMQNGAVLGSTGRGVLRAQLCNGAAVPKQIEPNEVVHERCSACSDDSALGKPCSLQPTRDETVTARYNQHATKRSLLQRCSSPPLSGSAARCSSGSTTYPPHLPHEHAVASLHCRLHSY